MFIILACVVLGLTGLVILAVKWQSESASTAVAVEGAGLLPESYYLSLIGYKDDRPGDSIDLRAIESAVRACPYVASAYVSTNAQNQIEITIEERTPVALFVAEGGRQGYIASDGAMMPYRLLHGAADIPVAQIVRADSAAAGDIAKVAGRLNAAGDDLRPVFSEIIRDRLGSISLRDSETGTIYILGRPESLDLKINKLMKIKLLRASRRDLAEAAEIDLRWSDKAIIR
ncbi:MAG: cell division protein FtsQ/DivIB [Candidatus Kapaibacterium sp.]